ncbi:MAG: 1,4-alpha-glucan branching protein GlgB [Defluviimonas sp.]|uniref:1,4-alpha-glucan branching protein GlgB n=1 Tax=Albidovulum sp. TaxID=1872424 RepID=UPI001E0FC7DF|nr:1,4-alpha-glucan branching protein GlgB [Paracoccaceae bacterium]MCC0064661.1 1,4-alpha-glucan branching protein GlgB [Defluviimonas sp.]
MAALAEARHGDPFAMLGPHGDHVLALLPEAAEVWLLRPRAKPLPMQRHPDFGALFIARHDGAKPYRLRVAPPAGDPYEIDDPYRFAPLLGEIDEYLIGEGTHRHLWRALGAHLVRHGGAEGTHFAVWAPNARRVSVVGDFNRWDGRVHPMRRRGATGVWELFLPGVAEGAVYKYEILGTDGALLPLKADPVGFGAELPPRTGSVVRRPGGADWQDDDWLAGRAARNAIDAPISVYEVHLGSWRRSSDGGRPLSYLELADQLVGYADWMGFTHIELLPVSEHPFDGSWGYQPIGMYAPTVRHGTPQEFAALVDAAHRRGIGVIADWVPGHFPTDAHGLGRFDGTALYEHADPKEGFHTDWNTLIYNYGRAEVSNYLIANAAYWLEEYHLDGLRVDAVASMLYRDYSRRAGEWVPNKDGGRENYEAIAFLRQMNRLVYGQVPGILTAAEESTAFPGVSHPVDRGGLGFGYKWNMGWMNDTLSYMQKDPVHRRHHHNQMTFAIAYAWSENFILPISHDEVVHGKGSMLGKMPGDPTAKFANLRAYYSFMWTHPGKKLLFMGQEFAQGREWNHDAGLDWHLCDRPDHRGVQLLVRDLNRLYRDLPALHRDDCRGEGFEWLEADDAERSVFAFVRRGGAGDAPVVVVANFTPVERRGYRVGFPAPGRWSEIFNSDAAVYGGGERGNGGAVATEPVAWHRQAQSAPLTLPPLGVIVFRQG